MGACSLTTVPTNKTYQKMSYKNSPPSRMAPTWSDPRLKCSMPSMLKAMPNTLLANQWRLAMYLQRMGHNCAWGTEMDWAGKGAHGACLAAWLPWVGMGCNCAWNVVATYKGLVWVCIATLCNQVFCTPTHQPQKQLLIRPTAISARESSGCSCKG